MTQKRPVNAQRILFLTPDLFGPPGGIARHARLVCQALVEAGVDLTAVALHDLDKAQYETTQLFPRIKYYPCRSRRRVLAWIALVTTLYKRPGLIIVEHPNFSPLGWALARLSNIPFVVFAHGVDVWRPLSRMRQWALRQADRLICVSHTTAHRASEANGIDLRRTRILYNCLDPQLEPQVHTEISDEQLSILTVGRITLSEQYKGHTQIIGIMPALLKRFPGLVYHIVGTGDGQTKLMMLAKEHGVAGAVHFHGVVSEEELARHYASTSLFAMPSSGEGFGIVFVEAMAYGKPVIAGNKDAAIEVVRHGETGLVVDSNNPRELEDAIVRLLSDPALRLRMGTMGAKITKSQFSFGTFSRDLLAFLHEVTHGQRTGKGKPAQTQQLDT